MRNISFFIKVGAANVLLKRLFIKPGIQERGTECGECLLGFRGISKRIPGNVPKVSGECSTRFGGMFEEILGNVPEDSGECSRGFRECSRRFQEILKKISGNLNLFFIKFCN